MEEREFQRRREEARKEQDRVNRNRASSEHSSYFAEQEKAEREWRKEYDAMMENYWDEQRTSVGWKKYFILQMSYYILYCQMVLSVWENKRLNVIQSPLVDTEVKVDGKAKEVVEDLEIQY